MAYWLCTFSEGGCRVLSINTVVIGRTSRDLFLRKERESRVRSDLSRSNPQLGSERDRTSAHTGIRHTCTVEELSRRYHTVQDWRDLR